MASRYSCLRPYSFLLQLQASNFPQTTIPDHNSKSSQGKEGILIVKTVQAILICHYPDNIIPGNAASTVEKLADYLIGVGY